MHNFACFWIFSQGITFAYVGQNKTSSTVNSSIATLSCVTKRNYPLNMRVIFFNYLKRYRHSATFTIAWQTLRKSHSVKFYHATPLGVAHNIYSSLFVNWWAKLHNTF